MAWLARGGPSRSETQEPDSRRGLSPILMVYSIQHNGRHVNPTPVKKETSGGKVVSLSPALFGDGRGTLPTLQPQPGPRNARVSDTVDVGPRPPPVHSHKIPHRPLSATEALPCPRPSPRLSGRGTTAILLWYFIGYVAAPVSPVRRGRLSLRAARGIRPYSRAGGSYVATGRLLPCAANRARSWPCAPPQPQQPRRLPAWASRMR